MELIRRNMAADEMKADEDATMKDEIDLTLYDATPEPEGRPNVAPPSFKGRLNLNEYAFHQRTTPFSRNRPAPKVEESKSSTVKKEQNSPSKGSEGSLNRPLVLTPMPESDDDRGTMKREVKVEGKVEAVAAPISKSDQVATPTKVEKVEPNSPLVAPIQSLETSIIKVSKTEPNQEESMIEQVTKKDHYRERGMIELHGSSPEAEVNVRFAAVTSSINAPSRAVTASNPAAASSATVIPRVAAATAPHKSPTKRPPTLAQAPAPARPGPSVVPAARSPFFAASSPSVVAPSSKRPSDLSSCGSPAKKARAPSSYKPPETYAHLQELTDIMAPDLLGIFVGVNPGLKSAAAGHSYAGPSNRFWKLLHTSGITERRLSPQEDRTLPEKYQFGNTNIVDRPTRNQMELSKHEMVDSVQALIDKVRKWKPESVVIVGKKIWEIIFSVRHGRGMKKDEFNYGWQADSERMGTPKSWEKKETTVDGKPWKGARVFVATSTSGAAAIPPALEKERIWRELGEWVNKRREERGLTHYPPGPTYKKNL